MAKLGLDIGSSSLGWFINKSKKGVVTFETGMSKGQSGGYSSPTKDRREARSKRNLIRARKYRKWELLKILINGYTPLTENELTEWCHYQKGKRRKFPENENFLRWIACDFTYESGVKYKNPYELRVIALDEKLSNHELGRVLYHLVQRRGYKDIGETDQETEKQIQRRGESGFQTALDENRTIAEALVKEFLNKGERARNQYPYRDEYKKEMELICQAQGFSIAVNKKGEYSDEFVKNIWKAIIWQRPLKSQKGNIGKCTLEPSKLRCPISHPSFEIFRALQFINTIKYFDKNNEKQTIQPELKKKLFTELFLKQDANFKFQKIKEFLDIHNGSVNKYNYPINPKNNQYETSVPGMPICKSLVTLFGDEAQQALLEIEKFNIGNAPKTKEGYSIYDIWHIVFDFDEQHLEKFAIQKLGIENVKRKRKTGDILISPLVELKRKYLQGYSDVSLKAICKIIPFLKEGYLYNEAVVLAKIPELMGVNWHSTKQSILDILTVSNTIYQNKLTVTSISNNLIDKHKGQTRAMIDGSEEQVFAYKDFSYTLTENDIEDVKAACINHFGDKTWEQIKNKDEIIQNVGLEYQEYFFDEKRAYRKTDTLTEIFNLLLKEKNITLSGELYHHSNRENLYNKNLQVNFKTGEKNLPKYKETETEILPIPFIDSIKNPMFNKSMSIVRKLLNELIVNGEIDPETEVTVELARELNDNNVRAAIERYQKERRDNREKIRKFLEQYNEEENQSINVEDKIAVFELWTEQIFEEAEDENKNRLEILKEKEDVKRYELWLEQKGQCMYTGKLISIAELFSDQVDIEHTIPRSILPDNTMANKTLAFKRYNRNIKEAKTPFFCENFSKDTPNGTSISPRLDNWRKLRDYYKIQFETRRRAKGVEDEKTKNTRIQDKHYNKMHFDYWNDKLNRFEAEEVKDSWARRQLVDTQMVSKYAREYLKLYFKKVAVQKGSVTADFRKIFGFQEQDEIKSRNKHTHHAIDAAVLTMIPTNSSYREEVLKEYYAAVEKKDSRKKTELRGKLIPPYFNVQSLIKEIESTTLIVNYQKDKILQQTGKTVRKRGKIQYVKGKNGEFVLDENGDEIIKKATGDTMRSSLYAQTYLGKIRDVERYEDNQPKREKGDWKYKEGKEEFVFVKRENISKVKESDKLISAIIDPVIKQLIEEQKNNSEIKDYQGNIIRHVRIKTSTGKEVKERLNYRSKYDYKNKFYSEAGSVPYAILVQKSGNVKRELIPVSSFEIAKEFKKEGKFISENFLLAKYPELLDWDKKQLLKTGQKVIVLNNDNDFNKRTDIDFQLKRLFIINQFSDGSIWLNYHLNALSKDEVKKSIAFIKDEKMLEYEKEYNLPNVIENINIQDNKKRREDFLNRKFRFDTIGNSYRLSRLVETVGLEKTNEIKKELDKYKAIPSTIEIEGETPLLKMGKEKWNFLFEGEDFEISLDGKINWKI
jgi:CRISPR-associated endonuclease Csn1